MKKTLAAFLFLLTAGIVPAHAEENHITVYNNDLGLVRQVRSLAVPVDRPLSFTDVAEKLIPTSVHLRPLDGDANFRILEQNFEYDLVSPAKILEKYIDHPVELITGGGELIKGTLLSRDGASLVLKTESGIKIVAWNDKMSVNVKELPEGLITRPTLLWELAGAGGKTRDLELSYLTSGMEWHAEYVGVLGEDAKSLNMDAWVSVNNRCGATFDKAHLKLVAGEVHRAPKPRKRMMLAKARTFESAAAPGGFTEREFFEYHIYELERPTTIKNNQVKQIALFPPSEVKTEKKFYYNARKDSKKVEVRLLFKNDDASGLGKPLPAGVFRIYQKDRNSLEFVGEDRIDHTPRGEEVKITLGKAFDIVGERKEAGKKRVSKTSERRTVEIELRNNKKEGDAEVVVEEDIYCRYWEIEESNIPHEKKGDKAEFKVKVPANGKTTLKYTVLCSW